MSADVPDAADAGDTERDDRDAAARRRCWAEIDLSALHHNVRVVREKIGARAGIMAVLKANAYGHGAAELAKAIREDVQMFGVANVAEGRALREALLGLSETAPGIFILGPALPHEREEIVRSGFVPSVSSVEEAAAFGSLARVESKPICIHLVIDTGMGRIGLWQDEALAAARAISQIPDVEIAGIATHLPVADEDESFTTAQLASFDNVVTQLRDAGIRAPLVHSLNSAGVIGFSTQAGSLVRPGLMLYGSSPMPDFQKQLRAVLTWKTRITLVRDVGAGRSVSYGRTFITPRPMRIATLAVGYADGYRRHLSNRSADVLIGGKRCAVLGRVTMDQIMTDVTHVPGVGPGDEVVLMGPQGSEEILASELAKKVGTIAWEIFTGIGPRVERAYFDRQKVEE